MKHWAWLVWAVVVIGFIALVVSTMSVSRGGKRFSGQGRVVHTFPDGKLLVLLQVDYGRQHNFTYRQKRFLSEVRVSQDASARDDSLCLWLAIYDPRTNRWSKPKFENALLTIGEEAYPQVKEASLGESSSGAGLIIGAKEDGSLSRIPRPTAVLFSPEPTAQRHAEARLWLNQQAQPVQFAFEVPATLLLPPSPPPSTSLPAVQRQQVGALTFEFRGLKFADSQSCGGESVFLVPDLRILHSGRPLAGYGTQAVIEPSSSIRSPFSLTLPSAEMPAWTVRAYVDCHDPDELVRDAFSDYFDLVLPAPRRHQVVPVNRSVQIEGAQLKVIALVGAGALEYRLGEPLPRQAAPLPKGASTTYQLSPREAQIVSTQPYLLCELTLPWRATGGGANQQSLSFDADTGEMVAIMLSGAQIDPQTAIDEVIQRFGGVRSLVAIPLKPQSVTGTLKMRVGLQRTRVVAFQTAPLEAARVARMARNALTWRALGDQQRFETTMRMCLHRYRQSQDPITLTYLGLLCTVAALPREEFEPLVAPLSQLVQKDPSRPAYHIALNAVLTRAGRPKEAVRRSQMLNAWWISDSLAQVWHALALVETGRHAEAKRLLTPHLLQDWRSSREIYENELRFEIIAILLEEYERKTK